MFGIDLIYKQFFFRKILNNKYFILFFNLSCEYLGIYLNLIILDLILILTCIDNCFVNYLSILLILVKGKKVKLFTRSECHFLKYSKHKIQFPNQFKFYYLSKT